LRGPTHVFSDKANPDILIADTLLSDPDAHWIVSSGLPPRCALADWLPIHLAFIIQSYGAVLSPMPGETKSFSDTGSLADRDQGNISRAMGSVVGIACLRAEERFVPQLTSHVFGLLHDRGIYLGAWLGQHGGLFEKELVLALSWDQIAQRSS
jgi:hypothetical protein